MLIIILYLLLFSAAREAASYGYPRNEHSTASLNENLRFSELDHEPRIYVAAPSGVLVAKMRAFHVDDPEAKILYRLHGDNIPSNDAHFFQINADSGNLTTKRYIDRPVGSIYEVVVIAYTYNNDIGYINLTIRVTEYNKFPPHFLLSNYRIEVGLLTPLGTELAVVHAADNDREPYNAEVYYMLQSRSSLINVHRSTGSVTLKENLSPRFRDLVFTIIAYDGGSPHRIARTKLTMTVKLISVPQNVVVEHTGDQWAMLCWQPPASGVPLGYIISLTTDFVSSVLTTRNITVNELGYKNGRICTALADLESWSNFEARIAGWNGEETGMMSPSVEFNTRVNRTCYSLNNSEFKCSCSAGFYGTNCSLFNPCDRSVSPCLNGGKCFSNSSDQFECECPSGYFGKSCEIYNPCSLAECQHGSTCYNETATKYACKCLPGYTGVFCEVDIDECADKPCLNGGSCSDEIGLFKCICRSGFEGERCEVNIDECSSNVCKNNGTCIDGEASFKCRCQPGYTGSFCETDIDECLSNPCENNSTCINNVASYTCICGPGYEGDYCDEEINECISWPCFNGGTCIDAFNDYKCVCPPGFTGLRCEVDIDLCASKPCKNGGTCVDNVDSLSCQCVTGFRGQFCQIKEECRMETVSTSRGKFTWSNLEFDNIAIMDCPYGVTTNETLLDLMNQKQFKRSAREQKKASVWKVDIFEVDEEYRHATAEKKEQRRLQLEKRLQMSSLKIGRAFAVRSCILQANGSAIWAVMQDTLCREEGFNAAEELSQNLENLTKVPSHISSEMFLKATNHIHQIINFALQDRKIAQTMITVLSNMLDVNGTVLDEADRNGSLTRGLLNAIDTFTKEVHLSPHSNISFTSPNIALQVFSFSQSDVELYNNGISYRPSYLNSSVKINKTSLVNSEPSNESSLQNENDVNIIIPREAIQRAVMGSNDIRVQFVSFSNKKLFRSNTTSDITGRVITASIKNTSITNLTEPVIYNLQNTYGYQKQICVYWDMERSEWKTNGVLTNQTVEWINCQSMHLTAFSVLLDPSPDGSRVKSIYAHHEATLTTISYVGAVLSIVGLLFTIFTYAMFRCLNRDRAGKILLNLCFSLLLMNISYLLLSLKENVQNYFEQTDICMAVALSIHYLVLTSLAWMLVEAVNMYQLLITVFASSETRFMMKRMLFAWGIPLCIVGLTLSYTGLNNYKSLDPDICVFSPQNHNIYYISYIGPACTILFINCVVFLRVSRVLCQRRSVGKYSTNSKGGVTAAQVRGAFTVMTLLGVTWIVGVFAVGKLRLVFQYVFCISNSLQGFIIFVVRCVQYPEARSAWSTLFRTGHLKKHRGPSKAGFGPSSHTSSTQQTRATGKADLTERGKKM